METREMREMRGTATLGERLDARSLRVALAARNISVTEFAALAGISRPYLHDILQGRRGLDAPVRDKITRALAALAADPPPEYRPPRPRAAKPHPPR